MTEASISGQILTIRTPHRRIDINLSRALQATMYARPETRTYSLTEEFTVAGVYPLVDGVRVHLAHPKEGLFIPLIVKPFDNGFRLIIDAGAICEQFELERKLMELHVLPELMTSRVGEDGFFLLPCFSGTLVRFKAHAPTVNRDRIYMKQEEWEKLNLINAFAVNRAGEGILAVVHRGDFNCHVTTELNQDGANRIYASLEMRRHIGEQVKPTEREIIYYFAEGNAAEYPGLAQIFRRYLMVERGVSPLKGRLADNPTLAYSVTAMRTKIFMALKRPFVPDGRSPVQTYTTCAQAEEILRAMQEAGIKKAIVTLVGWNLGGHDGAYPTRFPVEPDIGGEEGLRRLIQTALGMGYQVVPHDNWTDVYRVAPDYDADTVARDEHGLLRIYGPWGGGQALKACPLTVLERYGFDFNRVRDLGFNGHYYMDAQSSVLWTCHHPHHPADEETFMRALARVTQVPRAIYGGIATEQGPVHHLPYIDEIATIPSAESAEWLWKRAPEAFHRIVDRVVPFYQIAVHGLATYQMSWIHGYRQQPGGVRKGALRELGLGARPSMEVEYLPGGFGDVYTDSLRDIQEPYRRAFEELAGIHAEPMEEFTELSREASRITYANGVTVSVNWSEEPVDGLAPLSYQVEKG